MRFARLLPIDRPRDAEVVVVEDTAYCTYCRRDHSLFPFGWKCHQSGPLSYSTDRLVSRVRTRKIVSRCP